MNKGWRYESHRHSLAARGIKTKVRSFNAEKSYGNTGWLKLRTGKDIRANEAMKSEGFVELPGWRTNYVRPEDVYNAERHAEMLNNLSDAQLQKRDLGEDEIRLLNKEKYEVYMQR